jgi:hypothetical protein
MDAASMTTGCLTMEPTAYSSGVPVSYRVIGMPDGQTAELIQKTARRIEVWKVRFGGRGRFSGQYDSPEMALVAIQNGKISAAQGE